MPALPAEPSSRSASSSATTPPLVTQQPSTSKGVRRASSRIAPFAGTAPPPSSSARRSRGSAPSASSCPQRAPSPTSISASAACASAPPARTAICPTSPRPTSVPLAHSAITATREPALRFIARRERICQTCRASDRATRARAACVRAKAPQTRCKRAVSLSHDSPFEPRHGSVHSWNIFKRRGRLHRCGPRQWQQLVPAVPYWVVQYRTRVHPLHRMPNGRVCYYSFNASMRLLLPILSASEQS